VGLRRLLRQPQYVANHRELAAGIESCKAVYRQSVAKGDRHMAAVQNLLLSTILYNRDLSCVLEDAEDPASEYHRNLLARLMVLTVDECFVKMPGLIGRPIRDAFADWGLSAERTDALAVCGKKLTEIKRLYEPESSVLRDNVIGHRDADAVTQAEMMDGIDCGRVDRIGTVLMSWTNELYNVLMKALNDRLTSMVQSPA
jgi:hypothetical protein